MNRLRERITHITMTDQGCMLRAYDRRIVETINRCREINTFIPALAYTFANNPVEIEVAHAERAAGESKYSLYSLIRLNFDLVTGFSVVPLQAFSLIGAALSVASAALVIVLALRRIFVGPEAEGLFTLFGIAFFLIGVTLLGIGLLGEYVGRIYEEVRGASALDRAGRARARRTPTTQRADDADAATRASSSRITTSASAAC